MSHHLDTPLARQNGQLYIDDLYVFPGDGSTVFIMDVNSDITGAHAEPGFHPEARYEIKVHASVVAATDTSDDPDGYGQAVARQLFPDVLPYVVGTPASYGFANRNGRTLADNAPEAMLSFVTNTAVPSGLRPSVAKQLRQSAFPYVMAV